MKWLQRLFIKKDSLKKAINLDYTTYSASSIVMFIGIDSSKNISMLKKALALYTYTEEELKDSLSVLKVREERLKERIKFARGQSQHGNIAGQIFDTQKMIRLITIKK